MAFDTEIFSREIHLLILRSFELANNASVFGITNIILACCDGANFGMSS